LPAKLHMFETARDLGEQLAGEILAAIAAKGDALFLLGCPAGRSLRSTYEAFARLAAEQQLDLSRLVIVMMDDYVTRDAGGRFAFLSETDPTTCLHFAEYELRQPINSGLAEALHLRAENIWFPDPLDPAAFDSRLRHAGGIDLFLLASGASDGHVAFNPQGSPRDSISRVIRLAEATRQDNVVTDPAFGSASRVPEYGVSVGIATIADLSRAAVLVLIGEDKQTAVRRVMAADAYDPDWPSTVIWDCAGPRVFADRPAAGAGA
jgi:glucosamine-6-phosphate deaminase